MSFAMEVNSAKVKYSEKFIDTVYDYQTTIVEKSNGKLLVSFIHWFNFIDFYSNWRETFIQRLEDEN